MELWMTFTYGSRSKFTSPFYSSNMVSYWCPIYFIYLSCSDKVLQAIEMWWNSVWPSPIGQGQILHHHLIPQTWFPIGVQYISHVNLAQIKCCRPLECDETLYDLHLWVKVKFTSPFDSSNMVSYWCPIHFTCQSCSDKVLQAIRMWWNSIWPSPMGQGQIYITIWFLKHGFLLVSNTFHMSILLQKGAAGYWNVMELCMTSTYGSRSNLTCIHCNSSLEIKGLSQVKRSELR